MFYCLLGELVIYIDKCLGFGQTKLFGVVLLVIEGELIDWLE